MVRDLRERLLERDEPYRSVHGDVEQRVRVESVELDISGKEHEVVILLRDPKRPDCLFGWRAPTIESDTDFAYPESWATVVWANLEEYILAIGYGLPRNCSNGGINWF